MMPLHISGLQRNHRHMPNPLASILLRRHAARLDADLAAGAVPETSPLHAARARQLVSPAGRDASAANWEHLLLIARRPTRGLPGHAPIRRERVLSAESEIRELITALRASGPIPARGVAIAMKLLGDGRGPIYDPGNRDELAMAVARAVTQLDPALPLIQPQWDAGSAMVRD
jgi:hypothetical protein